MKETYERDIQKRSIPQTHLHLHLSTWINRDLWKRPMKKTYGRDLWKRPMKETMKETYERDLWKRHTKKIDSSNTSALAFVNVYKKRPIWPMYVKRDLYKRQKEETNSSETPALAFVLVLARALARFLACAHALVSTKKRLMCVKRDLWKRYVKETYSNTCICICTCACACACNILLLVLVLMFQLKTDLCLWKETYKRDKKKKPIPQKHLLLHLSFCRCFWGKGLFYMSPL